MPTVEPDSSWELPEAVPWMGYVSEATRQYQALLASNPDEPSMQRFFERNPSFLPGADDIGPYGHHGPWWDAVIAQPTLRGLSTRIPDFMFVRRDTVTIRPVCVEIEAPSKPWFNKNLTPNAKLIQALDQLNEWAIWFSSDANRSIFSRMYVPPEYDHLPIEPVFVLIYGRDQEFRPHGIHGRQCTQVRMKRDHLAPSYYLCTYDMLKPKQIARSYASIKGNLIHGFDLIDLPATFENDGYQPYGGNLMGIIDDISDCLARSSHIADDRKYQIQKRWNYLKKKRNYSIYSAGDTGI